ncbi:hypothetical protein BDZ85DRAFT_48224 [Elsinoe ampelina]|uniref:BTB domain-containing protein n=1 Tax=Elsinoe ampelina TaxID=302913 RepID=A0A6A6GKV6_9PEZI|nr:hypothetical protein BDZ85DRAFT_48224 [Elsinoe ampelina]
MCDTIARGPRKSYEGPPANIVFSDPYDVELCVGSDQSRVFRVSSAMLSDFSPVFKAMFSERWAEGYNLAAGYITRIDFPEDNPKPFEVLLKAAHHLQIDDSMAALTSREIFDVFEVGDKYLCLNAIIRRYVYFWHDRNGVAPSLQLQKEIPLLLAYHLDEEDEFYDLTLELLHGSIESFTSLMPPHSDDIRSIIYAHLEGQRVLARSAIRECYARIERFARKSKVDEAGMEMLPKFSSSASDQALRDAGDDLLRIFTIDKITSEETRFPCTIVCRCRDGMEFLEMDCELCTHRFERKLRRMKKTDFDRYCRGLCLKCIKKGMNEAAICVDHCYDEFGNEYSRTATYSDESDSEEE